MLMILTIVIFIYFIISLFITRDILSPSCTLCISYLIAALSGIVLSISTSFDYSINNKTMFIIVFGVGVFIIVSNYIYLTENKGKTSLKNNYIVEKPIVLKKSYQFFLLSFQLITLICYSYFFYKGVGGFTLHSFTSVMSTFRDASYYNASLNYIPFIVEQMAKITKSIAYISMYIIIFNLLYYKKEEKKSRIDISLVVSILLYFPIVILTGGRYYIILFLFSAIFMWNILHLIIFHERLEFKDFMKLIFIVIAILFFFSFSRSLVGRRSKTAFFEYVLSYIGYNIKNLDIYLQSITINDTKIWGKETFYGINRILSKFGIIEPYKVHLAFVSEQGRALGNVYTGFRNEYHDFGFGGVVILQMIKAIITTHWYDRLLRMRYKGHTEISIGVIMYADVMSTIIMHSYSESFYATVFSIQFIVTIISMYIIRFFLRFEYAGNGKFIQKK